MRPKYCVGLRLPRIAVGHTLIRGTILGRTEHTTKCCIEPESAQHICYFAMLVNVSECSQASGITVSSRAGKMA